MRKLLIYTVFSAFLVSFSSSREIKQLAPGFKVLVLSENGGHHVLFTQAAQIWLNKLALDSNFSIEYIQSTAKIDDIFLDNFQVFVQLDFPPYGWGEKAESAFQKYINKKSKGWVGFHHASLLGEFDGYPMWGWFSDFMGGIRFKDYIPGFAEAKVGVEDDNHPVMRGVPKTFIIKKDEWYTYDKSPRSKVQVLASVDEASYIPDSKIKMGDHPVIWTNDQFAARNIYIFMGHSPDLFDNQSYTTIFRNAVFWAAHRQ